MQLITIVGKQWKLSKDKMIRIGSMKRSHRPEIRDCLPVLELWYRLVPVESLILSRTYYERSKRLEVPLRSLRVSRVEFVASHILTRGLSFVHRFKLCEF